MLHEHLQLRRDFSKLIQKKNYIKLISLEKLITGKSKRSNLAFSGAKNNIENVIAVERAAPHVDIDKQLLLKMQREIHSSLATLT